MSQRIANYDSNESGTNTTKDYFRISRHYDKIKCYGRDLRAAEHLLIETEMKNGSSSS